MSEISQDVLRTCIKGFITANKISHKELGARIGISEQAMRNYLSNKNISEKTLVKISNALGYPMELLQRGERYYGPDALRALEDRVKALEDAVFGSQGKGKDSE